MSLDSFIKDINKTYKMDNLAVYGVKLDGFKETFSLGTPSWDFCVYNSIPRACFIELVGPESSGKTTAAFLMAGCFIRQEKKKPIEERKHILFIDAEGTADPTWSIKSGYDMNDEEIRTVYVKAAGQSAEQLFDIVINGIKTGEIGLVIFDSLVAIAPQQVSDAGMTKKDMGTLAKCISDFVKRSTGLINRYKTTFIGINGLYLDPNCMFGNPEKTAGGNAWKRACSLRLRFKRGKFFNEDGSECSDSSPAGHVIEMAVLKTKFCKWDRKLGRCHLHYTKGIDVLWDTIEVATHFGIINKINQSWYNFIDLDSGQPITDSTGKEIKVNGEANIKKYLEENVDFWRTIYDKVYELIAIKDNPNVVSFEKMLGINIEEEFGINLKEEQMESD